MICNVPSNSEISRLSWDVNTWVGLLHLYSWDTQQSHIPPLHCFPDMDGHFYQELKGWRIPKLCLSGIKDCWHLGFHLMR